MEPPELATTVLVTRAKRSTTDGPFVAVKEALKLSFPEGRTTSTPRSSSPPRSRLPSRRRDRDPAAEGMVGVLSAGSSRTVGRVLASLIGYLGDFDLAEEAAAGGVRDRR